MRISFADKFGRGAKWLVIITGTLIVFALFAQLVPSRKISNWIVKRKVNSEFVSSKDAFGRTHLKVRVDALPEDQDERLDAAPVKLLPSEWAGTPAMATPDVSGEVNVQLLDTTRRFLTAWETFRPWNASTYEGWKSRVRQFADVSAFDQITSRIDSFQPKTICPGEGCPMGSVFVGIAPETWKVRSFDGESAYVTVEGFVRYKEVLGAGEQAARREYALLYRLGGDGRWTVSRAVADTLVAR
jgi:hypothetical protein